MKNAMEPFEALRPLMFSIAYRMLSSVSEAEDIVQEAFLRYYQASSSHTSEISSPRAYLSAVTTRLAIDHLRSARVRRERYVGQWLPEPLVTEPGSTDPSQHAEDAETLSMAFLLVLDRLSPVERAVFLLHDVFGFAFSEISVFIGKSDVHCRQLGVRARRHVRENRPRLDSSRAEREDVARRFFNAIAQGDVHSLVGLLAADAVAYGDGGGRPPSWPAPIVGRDRVARLLAGLGRQMRDAGVSVREVEVNAQPGIMVLDPCGALINAMTVDVVDGCVQVLRSVINPDKLGHLGPLADVAALLKQHKRGER